MWFGGNGFGISKGSCTFAFVSRDRKGHQPSSNPATVVK
jgi:hypothetical protein